MNSTVILLIRGDRELSRACGLAELIAIGAMEKSGCEDIWIRN
jgi:hypothetical protein